MTLGAFKIHTAFMSTETIARDKNDKKIYVYMIFFETEKTTELCVSFLSTDRVQ